jgi:flavodoxin
MKILVTYSSKTGNTEKVAKAIYDAVPVHREILPIDRVQDTSDYSMIFVGFPVQAHSVPGEAEDFLRKLPPGKNVAFFSTHGSLRGGQLPKQALEHAMSLNPAIHVLGSFGCRGKVRSDIIEMLMSKQEHMCWAEEARTADPHPDANDLADAAAFAAEVLNKLN